VTRSNGLTVTWSGGQAITSVEIEAFSCLDNNCNNGADIDCWAPAVSGTFTIPASALLALPAGNIGQLTFRPYANDVTFPGSGLNVTALRAWNVYFASLTFK
jgi:hypothetical protein